MWHFSHPSNQIKCSYVNSYMADSVHISGLFTLLFGWCDALMQLIIGSLTIFSPLLSLRRDVVLWLASSFDGVPSSVKDFLL